MVSSYISICLACCNKKSFRTVSPPPPPRNPTPPTNNTIRNNAFNENPFQISKNKSPYQSPNQFSPMRNQRAATRGTMPFHGSPAGPSGLTHGSDHYLEGSIGTLKRRMLSAPSLGTRKPYQTPKIRTGRNGKEKENERLEQDEEWYMLKKITPGERNRIPNDDTDDPVFYDKNGNRISNYRRRTPRSLPVSRATSAEDEDFKID